VKEESELLTGVFVVQLGFGTAAQVMAAAAEWATRRTEGLALADVLVQRGMLDADKRKMVEALSGRALQVNGGDVARTLQSLSSGLKPLLNSISSSLVPTPVTTRPSQGASQVDSLEGSENVSDEPLGRYDFETGPHGTTQELGRGGIGRVVVVHDRFLGRDVALKELLHEHTSNPSIATTRVVALEQRFLREARLTGQLEHPAIVPVFELGRRLDGGLYYTMQRVRGRTLHELLSEGSGLEDRLKHMGSYLTVCLAIAYAHSRAVVHRDIKPQNVMVGPFGETYVLDWGLARVKGKKDPRAQDLKLQPDITGNALEGGAIGTPSYMSPEQAEGKIEQIDERSDVWCLGAVLYEMLTGRPPYTGVNPFDVLAKITKSKVVPVREREPQAPPELAAIAEKALQHKREERYANAEEMAKDIDAWLRGARVGAHEYSSWELVRRFGRRNRLSLSVTSVAAVLLLVLGGYGIRQVRQQRDQARAFAQLFLEEVSDKLEPIAGSKPLVEELTHKTLDYYRANVDPKSGPRDERIRLATTWLKIGRLAIDVDRFDDAASAFSFAKQVAQPLAEEEPYDPRGRVLLSAALVGLGDVPEMRGDTEGALKLYTEATVEAQAAVSASPDDFDALDALSRTYNRKTAMLTSSWRQREALEPAQKGVEVDRRIAALQPDNDAVKAGLAISIGALATVYMHINEPQKAMQMFGEEISIAESVLQRNASDIRAMRAVGDAELYRAALSRAGKDETAWREHVEHAYDVALKLVKKEPNDTFGRVILGSAEVQIGKAEDAYKMFAPQADIALSSDGVAVYAQAMFFTSRYAELIELAANPAPAADPTVKTFAALGAALKGDAATSARLAQQAGDVSDAELTWIIGLVTQRIEGDSPLLQQARRLAERIDEGDRTLDNAAKRQALLDYAKALKTLE
jgi:serine/threonine protein kinase